MPSRELNNCCSPPFCRFRSNWTCPACRKVISRAEKFGHGHPIASPKQRDRINQRRKWKERDAVETTAVAGRRPRENDLKMALNSSSSCRVRCRPSAVLDAGQMERPRRRSQINTHARNAFSGMKRKTTHKNSRHGKEQGRNQSASAEKAVGLAAAGLALLCGGASTCSGGRSISP